MKPKPVIETVSLSEFVYGGYLGRHNLAVVKVKWSENKKTGLKEPHVYTEEGPNGGGDCPSRRQNL